MSLALKAAMQPRGGGFAGRPVRLQGDPGLGSIFRAVGRAATGFVTGGIPGAIGGILGGAIGGSSRPPATLPGGAPLPQDPRNLPANPGDIRLGPVSINPPMGGRPGVGIGFGAMGVEGTNGTGTMLPPRGHRANKTSYFLRDGTFVPAGSKWVKVRRRNPLNPRALSRAMGRLEGAKRASKALGRISIRKKC